jgi:hypothetical protein
MTYEYGQPQWNDTNKGRIRRKTSVGATVCITNLIWAEQGANLRRHDERPENNRMSHGKDNLLIR